MKNIGFKGVVLAGVMVALSSGRGFSQDISSLTNGVAYEKDQYFTPGFHEAGVGTGIFWSPIGSTYSRPRVDYVMGDVEIDYMLTHMFASGFWRNNFEVAVEGFGAGIYQNTGHYIAGGTLWFRHNLVPEGMRIAPYVELGMGMVSMDINHAYDGHNFNFNLDAAGGIRYFVTPKFSLNAQFQYQHISNANTADHNIGINAIGPVLGASFFF
jgi:hypothetical protein